MDKLTVFAPVGMIGEGVSEVSIDKAKEAFNIDVIACDGGSIDSGPYYLGTNTFSKSTSTIKRDLRMVLKLRQEADVPFLMGSSGTSGTGVQVDKISDIVKEISKEESLNLKLGRIYSDIDNELLIEKIERNDVEILDYDKELTEEDAKKSENVVSLMGWRPFIDAINQGCDVVLGGRSVDIAPFAAIPIKEGYSRALAAHMGMILDCGAMAAEERTGDKSGNLGMIAQISDDYFDVFPVDENMKCTVNSISSRRIYEEADPYIISLPEGNLELFNAKYDQLTDRKVRVSGSNFRETDYSLLLEGVENIGYRNIVVAGTTDPELINVVEDVFEDIKRRIINISDVPQEDYQVNLRTYGDGSGVSIFSTSGVANISELCIIIDVIAKSRGDSKNICSVAYHDLLHYLFEGYQSPYGNLAFPFSPMVTDVGEVYTFSIHHRLTNVDDSDVFKLEIEVV